MSRNYEATTEARRHVVLGAAALLESAVANGDAWLFEEGKPDDATVRRRVKALRRLVAKMRKMAELAK